MNLLRVFAGVGKRTGLADTPDVHTAEQFRRVLARERARAHRTGDCLSLLSFELDRKNGSKKTGILLELILRQRLRCTDEVGWLDEQHLGALLPTTSVEGAWKVAADVCLKLPVDAPPPFCTVYSYSGEEGNGREAKPGDATDAAASPGKRVLSLESLFVRPTPRSKRALDLVGSGLGLVALAPLFALIAAAVKVSSPGPVFFKQRRTGWGGKPFLMYKFRTMVADAENRKATLLPLNEQDGPAFKVRHDPRVTRLGRFLRSTSFDELPQLWNVLKGDMSLVGPRPLPCEEMEACDGWHRQRLDVMPGLTCYWQVRGRSTVSFADWVRMDVEYISSRSFWQDFKLLLLTVPAVVSRRGAH
jgi:lipopolysaccharide/colanic/teichoic acid biosynthesis glycosyltransferase